MGSELAEDGYISRTKEAAISPVGGGILRESLPVIISPFPTCVQIRHMLIEQGC